MSGEPDPRTAPEPEAPEARAFELWLRHSLQRLHGAVLEEPLPAELLRIIEDDRARRDRRRDG